MIDLISERAGGQVIEWNDEFFAPAERLILSASPIANDEYTDRGKWMDGWETRRRREPGHDWCVIKIGIPGRIERVVVDTSHFTGNYAPHFSLEATGAAAPDAAGWSELIPKSALEGDSVAEFEVSDPHRVELVRLNIFPDGGVARLRVAGEPLPAMELVCPGSEVDLASAMIGGSAIAASDTHYSQPSNLLRPVPSAGMWDGWETKRRRDDGHDWVVVRLGLPGTVRSLIVDTTHFKGNAPGWVSVDVSGDGEVWDRVAEMVPVAADSVNRVDVAEGASGSYVRLSIHPDGGLARLRVMGVPDQEPAGAKRLSYLNALFDAAAHGFFATACSSAVWVSEMTKGRPYSEMGSVLDRADQIFDGLSESDWLEAFAGHPRIGEPGGGIAAHEQAGAVGSEEELAAVNSEYETKYGFTYIVYATGKTGEEMLSMARERLGNTREDELANAAIEQRKITSTRLLRMLCQEPVG